MTVGGDAHPRAATGNQYFLQELSTTAGGMT
jgi:hypothetical protein